MDSAIQDFVSKILTVTIENNQIKNPYFFLLGENETGIKRHLKIWKGKYYDYIVCKEFNTLAEWVADAGAQLEDVFFGENRGRARNYILLNQLLAMAGYTAPSEDMDVDDITAQMSKLMAPRGLTIENVYVCTDGDIYKWETFMDM